jgi:hypothetical protein
LPSPDEDDSEFITIFIVNTDNIEITWYKNGTYITFPPLKEMLYASLGCSSNQAFPSGETTQDELILNTEPDKVNYYSSSIIYLSNQY